MKTREYSYGNALKVFVRFEVSALLFVTLPQRVAKRLQTLQRRYGDTPRLRTPPILQERREEANDRVREKTFSELTPSPGRTEHTEPTLQV